MTSCVINDNSININRSSFTSVATNPPLTLHYSADGSSSGFTVTNDTSLLKIKEIKTSSSYISYNEVNYDTDELRYYRKSRHRWNNDGDYGEIIIKHTKSDVARSVYICIPVIIIDRPSGILERFIQTAHDAIRDGGSSFTINNLSFNSIVPRAPFISYTCDNDTYIVFDIDHAWNLSSSLDNVLPVATTPTNSLYSPEMELNKDGPTSTDEIYIECQPTGTYGSEVVNQSVSRRKSTNTILIILAVIVVVGGLWLLFMKGIPSLGRSKSIHNVPVRRTNGAPNPLVLTDP